jgi:hypothetical protein
MPRSTALEHLLQEIGNELRSRREPEHIFTASAIGAMGAIAGGTAAVATVPALASAPIWQHPAIIGAATCFLIGLSIVAKTERENRVYRAARLEQTRLYALFAKEHALLNSELPKGLRLDAKAGRGHWFSSAIVIAATVGSLSFCLAVWVTTKARPTAAVTTPQTPVQELTPALLPAAVSAHQAAPPASTTTAPKPTPTTN